MNLLHTGNDVKTRLIAAICLPFSMAACVHTTPMPVQVSQEGDSAMSCRAMANEIQDMRGRVSESDSAGTGQVAKNVGLGIAGAFLIVPWFFMDTSDAHSVEAKAASARYKKLNAMYEDKDCPSMTAQKTTANPAPLEAKGAMSVSSH